MLCTNCGRTVKPVISVDIDGTLGDYHNHFLRFAEHYMAERLPSNYGGGREFSEYLQIEKRTYRDIKLAYRQGGMKRSMPMYPGASTFVRQMRDAGIELWIATTRPWQRLDNIDPDTRFWLDQHGIAYDGMVYGDDKYAQLIEQVNPERVVMVIDDLLEQCLVANSLGLRVFQPARTHNSLERWSHGFATFDEAARIAHQQLEAWKVGHGA